MAKYLIIGGVLVLLLGGIVYSRTASNPGAPLTPQTSFSHAHGLAVDAQDQSKLYIATHEGLLLLQGEKDLYRVGAKKDDLMGFTAHPSETQRFFSSGHPASGGNIGFQKTMDGGLTWEKISNGIGGPVDFHSMTISQTNPDIVYGYFRGLQRSMDGGKNWEMTKGTIAPIALSTHPTKDILYAATQDGVHVSEDRGDSWKSLSPGLEGGAVSVFFLFPDSDALAFAERLSGMGRSEDGGVTWEKIEESFGGGVVMYLARSAQSGATYAVTDRNTLYKSLDQGSTWRKIRYNE